MQRGRGLRIDPAPEHVHAAIAVRGDHQLPGRGGGLLGGGEAVRALGVEHMQQVAAQLAQRLRVVPGGLLQQERLPLSPGRRRHCRGQGSHRGDHHLRGVLPDRPRGQRRRGGRELPGHRLPAHAYGPAQGGGQAHLPPRGTGAQAQRVPQPPRGGGGTGGDRGPLGIDLTDQAQPLGGQRVLRPGQLPQPGQQLAVAQRPQLRLGQRGHRSTQLPQRGKRRVRGNAAAESVLHTPILMLGPTISDRPARTVDKRPNSGKPRIRTYTWGYGDSWRR